MLRGAILVGAIILVGTACGTDSNGSFESDYSEDGAWRDVAEKGCIENMPAELHIEVEVDGKMRVLDMALDGDHTDVHGHLEVDDDVAELREWNPGQLLPTMPEINERSASLSGFVDGSDAPIYRVGVNIVDGTVHAVTVGRIVDDGRSTNTWTIVVSEGVYATVGMDEVRSLADGTTASLKTACL